jgi:hypothetical protein
MAKDKNVTGKGSKYLPVCLWITTLALLTAVAFQLAAMKALYVCPF